MSAHPDRRGAAARQLLETELLCGVEFVPVRRRAAVGPAQSEPAEATIMPAPAPGSSAEAAAGGKAEALEGLRQEHDQTCPHCTRATGHTQTVFGEGDADAELMFIGEAPGAEEDRTGRPFVGRAGQKLDEIIAAMGLEREQVYIANILKSRPPDNRTPLPDEVDACAPFLAEQIRIIRPSAIVALGGPSAKFLLQTSTGITRLRGQWGSYADLTAGLTIPVMPTFHPAYLLRNYTKDTRKRVWSDMQAVLEVLGR